MSTHYYAVCPRCKEHYDDAREIASLRTQIASERSRANRLADECGHLRSLADASEANVVAANAKVGDLESTLRSHERTIQRLRDQIIKLGARPV